MDAVEGASAVLRVLVVLCEAFLRHRRAHGLLEGGVILDVEKVVDLARRAARAIGACILDEAQPGRIAKHGAGAGTARAVLDHAVLAIVSDELLSEDRVRHHLEALQEKVELRWRELFGSCLPTDRKQRWRERWWRGAGAARGWLRGLRRCRGFSHASAHVLY